ncbi:chitin deacetylase 7 [Folsomia candida]|uniref:chitin deacetylase 7 n=1 Tax=Folsomia candida TaxID=158441 RepID=UPI000B8FA535|nr:chitin deacetylase 7 [Folsomia candida]
MAKLTILSLALCGLLAIVFSGPTKVNNVYEAPPCDVDACQLPSCRCSSQTPPGNLIGPNVPQMVFLTFDDAITVSNHPFYEEVLFNRINQNGAKIAATFFITHEYSNYSLVHDLWARGHDIALHSITHVSDTGYWANLNESMWRAEIVAQKQQLSTFASVPLAYIKGVRAPFLQVGGNPMYSALVGGGFEWDCSRPTQNQRIPGLWPYTNDYASTQDCQIPTCPDEAFPGFWTFPMIDLIGDDQFPCAMVDECTPVPMTQAATYNLLMRNFENQYNGNRAPFGVFTHAAWLVGPADRPEFAQRKAGYIQFLDEILAMPNVYIVGISQAMEWMKTPTGTADIDTFVPWLDDPNRVRACPFPRNCRYENSTWERFMSSCIPCPPEYPWVHNPQGTNLHYDD